MTFQPKDIVRIKGTKEEWHVIDRHCGEDLYDIRKDGIQLDAMVGYNLELVRRPGPVVFECTWMSDGIGLPIYPFPTGDGGNFPIMQGFLRKKTRVTVEVLEEGM